MLLLFLKVPCLPERVPFLLREVLPLGCRVGAVVFVLASALLRLSDRLDTEQVFDDLLEITIGITVDGGLEGIERAEKEEGDEKSGRRGW